MARRTISEIAEVLYGDKLAKGEVPGAEGGERRPPRSDAELASVLYPEANPRFPEQHGPEGVVNDLVRDRDGTIMHQAPYGGDLHANARLAGAHADQLAAADLSRMDFVKANASTSHGDLRGALARGTKFLDLAHSDIRDMEVDETTDITGVNFFQAKIGEKTYQELKRCQGFDKAVNLVRPRSK
jgi:hypothetical protein